MSPGHVAVWCLHLLVVSVTEVFIIKLLIENMGLDYIRSNIDISNYIVYYFNFDYIILQVEKTCNLLSLVYRLLIYSFLQH